MVDSNVIRLMHDIRKDYCAQQHWHYLTFASFAIILLLDVIIIIYTRAVTLDGYSWAGIILLFTLLLVEGLQYKKYGDKIVRLDEFYLSGEYHDIRR